MPGGRDGPGAPPYLTGPWALGGARTEGEHPMSTPLAVAAAPTPEPRILRALCLPPDHQCGSAHQRAIRSCTPLLVIHQYSLITKVRLTATKPWRITAAAQRSLLQ